MKGLSLRQAQRCENAREPRCTCRCGGAKHGAARAGTRVKGRIEDIYDLAFFDALPDDDPHHIPSTERKRSKKQARRDELERIRADASLFDSAVIE